MKQNHIFSVTLKINTLIRKKKMVPSPVPHSDVTNKAVIYNNSNLTLDSLSEKLGVRCKKLLGKGRCSEVYDVLISFQRFAGKLWKTHGSNVKHTESLVRREIKIAKWAAKQGIGPKISGMRSTCYETQYEPTFLIMMIMEKMETNLASLMIRGSLSELINAWGLVFEHLRQDFGINTETHKGWLCCSDLKPENILIKSNRAGSGIKCVKFTDWDSRYCYVLPLSPESGIFLNQVILIFNSVLRTQRMYYGRPPTNSTSMLLTWPAESLDIASGLAHLENNDEYIKFLICLDDFMRKGPYYYARLPIDIAKSKHSRAVEFAKSYTRAFNHILLESDNDTSKEERHKEQVLKKTREIYEVMRDISLARNCCDTDELYAQSFL